MWEDSETKQFYEDTLDLKLFLPGYAFREPPAAAVAAVPATPEGAFHADHSLETTTDGLDSV